METSWYDPLRSVASKGSQAERPGSLAGLAAAREIHQGQFFTPDAVAALMWRIVEPAMAVIGDRRSISVMDNSVGSGRLLQFASPDKHRLYGLDVDGETIGELGRVAQTAGFTCEFETAGLETARPDNMDVALINPPFSLHLESPLLYPHPCTCYGKFGPNTSTLSHAYALAQALEAAQLVVALLPATFAEEVAKKPSDYVSYSSEKRLAAIIDLPGGLFKEENTEVRVSLLVFNSKPVAEAIRVKLDKLDADLPDLRLSLAERWGSPKLRVHGIEDKGPSITRPVTGDKTVRVLHDGRRISLRFNCGLTEAKVLNAVYDARKETHAPQGHRYPRGVRYTGQGRLDMEVHLAQPDPNASFESFLSIIRKAGGKPDVPTSVWRYLHRRVRVSRRQAEPMRHTVWIKSGTASEAEELTGVAKKTHVANPKIWGSPVVAAGKEIAFKRGEDGKYDFQLGAAKFRISPEEMHERFEIQQGAETVGWKVVHEGLAVRFPQVAYTWRLRAIAQGIDSWLTWQFQFEDLVELMMKPEGVITAWEMGLGKARLAAALILLSGCKHGLITVEAGLIEEMERELRGLPIPADSWQVIRSPDDVANLRRINVISYERLRLPIDGRQGDEEEGKKSSAVVRMHLTYAGKLRRRCGVVVSDEGDLLANPTSQQSRALWQLSAKKRYVLTGTPIANYPKDILPVLAYTAGDGTAAQPYGWYRGYLEPNWIRSMSHAMRGIDAFRDRFVCVEWVTREFEDTLIEGARREIPRIADLAGYRQMLAPHLKRRVTEEPDVAACVKMPVPDREVITLDWDESHLAFYLKVADDFRSWYVEMRRQRGNRNSNLVAILARLRAVSFAQDFPQHGVDGFGTYNRLTSKQRYLVDRVSKLKKQGHKVMLYAENPGLLELIGKHAAAKKVESTLFHGGITPTKRMRAFDSEFRFGPKPLALMSYGCGQKGLNVPQADYVLFGSRSWSATEEEQSLKRPCRPQQTRPVTGEYPHLIGGIDEYKAQLVAFKKDSAQSGLDWAEPETYDMDFLTLDRILEEFCDKLSGLKGVKRQDLRMALAA